MAPPALLTALRLLEQHLDDRHGMFDIRCPVGLVPSHRTITSFVHNLVRER